jgi:hypothetical protein
MPQGSCQMRIGYLFHTDKMQSLKILPSLFFFEFGDGYLTMIDSQEFDNILVIINIFVRHFYGCL